MRGFLARILIIAFGLWMADALLEGIRIATMPSLWIAALILGAVNAVVRPVVVLLTLPITLITLGLFLFVINGAMILLAAALLPSFEVASLGTAVLAAIIVSVTGWIANGFVGDRGRVQAWRSRE